MSVNDSTIWWQVYPLGFTHAPIRPSSNAQRVLTPRLDALLPWLDYLIGMGANGLLLGPIFASQTHGYDTVDYYRIDPRLGDEATFDRLIDACQQRGIRVMLDGVFNHVGREHPLFVEALAGRGHDNMFHITRHADGTVDYAKFEGHPELPELNHDSDEVVQMVTDVMLYWLRRGASAWRLDAAYAVNPAFWVRVLPTVRREFPHAWIMGEVIHGDYSAIVKESGMDSLTQYELWKAIWSCQESANFWELDWSLKRHNEFLQTFTPLTFVGNHDVTRIASKIGDAGAALAMTILCTVGGVPSIYYGDEQAFRGVKRECLGGDDDIRPGYPDTPAELSPAGEWMYHLIQGLIDIRRRNPWLVHATTTPLHLDNRHYTYEAVGKHDNERIVVDLNLDPEPHAVISQNGVALMHVRGRAQS